MRRTQLYLDDQLWNVLHSRAKSRKTTISQLVREAVRERYIGSLEERTKAMQEFVGTRKDAPARWMRSSWFAACVEGAAWTGSTNNDCAGRF